MNDNEAEVLESLLGWVFATLIILILVTGCNEHQRIKGITNKTVELK